MIAHKGLTINSVSYITPKEVLNPVLNCYQFNFQLNFKSYSKLSHVIDLSVWVFHSLLGRSVNRI